MNFKRYHASKNLLDFEALKTASSGKLPEQSGTCEHMLTIQCNPNTTYTCISDGFGSETETPTGTYRSVYFQNATATNTVFNNHPVTITTDATGLVYVGFYSTRINAEQYLNGAARIWLVEGSDATIPYEPYSSEVWHDTPHYIHNTSTDTLTTLPADIYANDITATVGLKGQMEQSGTPTPTTPIQPQECGDLETTGEHAEQYKIPILNNSQTTNVYLGEVQTTRKIKKLVLDGTESSWIVAGTGDAQCFRLDITGYLYNTINICYCTHYESQQNITRVADVIDKHCAFYANPNNIYYSFNIKDTTYTTVETFKEYLQQQYANGTPVTVWYVLATETTGIVNEPLRKIGTYADEVSGVTIPTIAGANTLSVDTTLEPSEVTATYKGWHEASEIVHRYQYGEWDGSPPTYPVYGFHVNPSKSDSATAVTYLEDAVGMTPATMGASTFDYGSWENAFFMPKPCMLKSNGTVDYYLDPNDYTKKADGTASDIANVNYDGNAMMEWGQIWYKFIGGEAEGEGYFYVSNVQIDDSYHCWCNYDSKDNITDHFYTAIYNGTGTSKLRSISGVALTNANGNGGTTVTDEETRAVANNTTTDVEWYIDVWSDRLLINALLVLIGKSLNTQAVFGRGLVTGSQAAKEAYVTGTLNDKGLFWGDTANGASAVKVFGMENWWGCCWHRTAGCISVNRALKIKLTYGTADGSTVVGYNQTGDGYISNGTIPSTNNYVKAMTYNQYGYMTSNVTGGSSSTYYADYFYQSTNTRYLLAGGAAGNDVAGAFCFGLSYAPSDAVWNRATSLSCKPLARRGE